VPFEIYVGDFERCIDEVDELDTGALSFRPASGAGPGGGKGAPPDFEALEDADLEDEVKSGRHFWRPAKELLLRQERDGASESDAIAHLEAFSTRSLRLRAARNGRRPEKAFRAGSNRFTRGRGKRRAAPPSRK
jgi:hypothetical protein